MTDQIEAMHINDNNNDAGVETPKEISRQYCPTNRRSKTTRSKAKRKIKTKGQGKGKGKSKG